MMYKKCPEEKTVACRWVFLIPGNRAQSGIIKSGYNPVTHKEVNGAKDGWHIKY